MAFGRQFESSRQLKASIYARRFRIHHVPFLDTPKHSWICAGVDPVPVHKFSVSRYAGNVVQQMQLPDPIAGRLQQRGWITVIQRRLRQWHRGRTLVREG